MKDVTAALMLRGRKILIARRGRTRIADGIFCDVVNDEGRAYMSFWKKAKHASIENRLVEEKIYEQVFQELESGVRSDGLWIKAFQKGEGDEQKAKALYIEYRVQAIKDEYALIKSMSKIQTHAQPKCEPSVKTSPPLEFIRIKSEPRTEVICNHCDTLNSLTDTYCKECGFYLNDDL